MPSSAASNRGLEQRVFSKALWSETLGECSAKTDVQNPTNILKEDEGLYENIQDLYKNRWIEYDI